MDIISKSILATMIYYNVLDFPLTAWEVFNFLINPNRIGPSYPPARSNLAEIINFLNILVQEKKLEEFNGFYFLPASPVGGPGRANLYEKRVEKNKIAEQKWKKARRYLRLGQAVPFIEAIFASGSLALGQTGPESDLDVLVVAKSGRIWLARVFLSLAMSILGVRRKNKERIAPDKICLNHYITTASLKIPFASLYNAQSYAHLVPVYWTDWMIIENFWTENGQWAKQFLCRWEPPDGYQRRAVRPSKFLGGIKNGLEKILDQSRFGNWLEKLARKIQARRIKTNLPGRITANDQQLEFHPYSIEKEIIQKYNQKISDLKFFGAYQEKDSGLQ